MKKILLFALILVTVSCAGSKKTVIKPSADLTDFQNTITEEGLFIDLNILASDSLEGRDTGSEGERKAADYLAARYVELGVLPAGDNGTYFQNYELEQTTLNSIEYVVTYQDQAIDEFVYSSNRVSNFTRVIGENLAAEGEIVFVGNANSFTSGHVDLSAIEFEGKWVLSFFDGSTLSTADFQQAIKSAGAIGGIIISHFDPEDYNIVAEVNQGIFENPSRLKLNYLNSEEISIHTIHPEFATQLLGLESIENLNELNTEILNSELHFEAYSINASLKYSPEVTINTLQTRNVVALIEGSDPELKDEVIVLSAHYDHIGVGEPDSEGDTIYNGADDDGSGTVGLLHTAQAFITAKNAGATFNRSVLFLHVSGEEKGLFGSRYFSDHPTVSTENMIANLNVDMIGRRDPENENNPDYVYIIGGKIISSGLQSILEEANQKSVNIELSDRYNDLNDPNQFYRRSDHWNFGRLGIPFIFYFNGTHADYHKQSDEIDKIDFEALRKRTQLLFMTTALLSNSESKPTVDNAEFILRTQE